MRLETLLIHGGQEGPRLEGAVCQPIFQSASFEYAGPGGGGELRYIRLNNTPNHRALHRKLAALEGAEAALVTTSGMAAIATTLLTLLRPGDHVLAQDCLYGGTRALLDGQLADLGIETTYVDPSDPSAWPAARRPTTRVLYVETISNPLVQVCDLPAAAGFARRAGLVSVVDNTFATPVNCRPIELGFDLVLHSATKYLNGHSDLVAGVVAGSAERVAAVRSRLDHLGGSLDPHACFLLDRGLRTLALRVRHQNASAAAIAAFLAEHPAVVAVHYPVGHDFLAGGGGVLAFEVAGGLAAAEGVLSRARLPIVAPSLGGVESLLTRPAATSHAGVDPAVRRALGVTDDLIRMAVGIEAVEDLIEDLDQALSA